jgi:hypothetical protein
MIIMIAFCGIRGVWTQFIPRAMAFPPQVAFCTRNFLTKQNISFVPHYLAPTGIFFVSQMSEKVRRTELKGNFKD